MVRYIGGGSFSEKTENGSVSYTEIACTSSDTKPTSGFATGSICVEVDTGSVTSAVAPVQLSATYMSEG